MSVSSAAPAETARRSGKYLSFFLGAEEYGLEILKVQEILGLLPVTRVPRTPAHMRGVVNLRGRVIPIMDLRLRFGMEATEATDQTCIIVVRVGGTPIGLVVDRVSEVLDIADEDVEDAPSFGTDVDTEYLLGIAKTGGSIRLLLAIERVVTTDDIEFGATQAE